MPCWHAPAGMWRHDGLFGAPPITVVVGDEAHVTLLRRWGCWASGASASSRVPADGQGRMRADALPRSRARPSSACRPATSTPAPSTRCARSAPAAHAAGAWVHVDGAFGLWAAAAPARAASASRAWRTPIRGPPTRTSGSTCPTTAASPSCATARPCARPWRVSAAYLQHSDAREPTHYTPELSRRARGVEVWAALRSLGRAGVADLIERCCRHAARFAEGLRAAGLRGAERRRPQPGAGLVRRRRARRGA